MMMAFLTNQTTVNWDDPRESKCSVFAIVVCFTLIKCLKYSLAKLAKNETMEFQMKRDKDQQEHYETDWYNEVLRTQWQTRS